MSGPHEPLPAVPPPTIFPLHVSADRRRLLDPAGRPVLLQGDAAWSLIANTTIEGTTRYLDERRALGFNTIMVSVVEYLFSADPPRDLAGAEPFLTPGDFTTPNPAYMDHVEQVLDLIAERGFLVLLAPAYLGYPHPHYPGFGNRSEGWYDEVVANGPAGNRSWGEYLGRRFGHFDNIMWMLGGDRNPGLAGGAAQRPGPRPALHRDHDPVHGPRPSRGLADRHVSRRRLARRQPDVHLRDRPSQADRRLEPGAGHALLPDRIDLRG